MKYTGQCSGIIWGHLKDDSGRKFVSHPISDQKYFIRLSSEVTCFRAEMFPYLFDSEGDKRAQEPNISSKDIEGKVKQLLLFQR